MANEEIKKIATEIARLFVHHDDNSPYREQVYRQVETTINLISKDYCIIPKVEILNQHAWYMQRMTEVSSNRAMNRGKAIALENLFGKEMFEEDKI